MGLSFSSISQPAAGFFRINERSSDSFFGLVFFESFACWIFLFSEFSDNFFSSFVIVKCVNLCSGHPYPGFPDALQ